MSYYDYNDSAKKSFNRDLFGDITQYNSVSRSPYQDSYRSPVKERLYQAKDSITGTVNNLSANKFAYNEGASEVIMVNQQLLNSLKYSNPVIDFPRYDNIEEKNLQLRRQLNQQMRKSNVLLRQYSQLESQNKGLKRQQSYYNSTAADTNNLRYQNERLRQQIQRKRQQMSVPQHLVDQLRQLRRENERLRQNAANLLYKKKSNY